MSKPVLIYPGYAIRYPLGGHLLTELHCIAGLQRLGYDVIYVEESGTEWAPCYNPLRDEMTTDPGYGIGVLRAALRPFGLEDQWCYVDSQRQYHGLSQDQLRDLCRKATVLFCKAQVNWLEEFRDCKTRVFVDLDPCFTQMRQAPTPVPSFSGYAALQEFHFHFTCGERIGQPDCPIPTSGLHWRKTRMPVVPELIAPQYTPAAKLFTTVLSWSAYGSTAYRGEIYGPKAIEFEKLMDLPRRTGPIFEIALAGKEAPLARLRDAGWQITSAKDKTITTATYLDYLGQSRGEFSVAKNAFVKSRCGVFLDRSVMYLTSGKPVILQDTGFSEFLPCGMGLFAFRTADDIVAAVDAINRDYAKQCRAARQLAVEHFDAEKVLGALLRECELPVLQP